MIQTMAMILKTEKWVPGLFDEYPTYEEWSSNFDFTRPADMKALEKVHESHLPVWSEGNVYLGGAQGWKHEKNGLISSENVKVELLEKDGKYTLDTNIYDLLGDFSSRMINTEVLGKAFEPEEPFENPDGTPIQFDADYFGGHRGAGVLPGPFAAKEDVEKNFILNLRAAWMLWAALFIFPGDRNPGMGYNDVGVKRSFAPN